MWRWWPGRERPKPLIKQELRGAPVRPRTKSYSSDNGFVYQYVYKGWRALEGSGDGVTAGEEHHFHVTQARGRDAIARVRLLRDELERSSQMIGREVLHAEQYAIAKLSLFEMFDEVQSTDELDRPRVPKADQIVDCLKRLGRL